MWIQSFEIKSLSMLKSESGRSSPKSFWIRHFIIFILFSLNDQYFEQTSKHFIDKLKSSKLGVNLEMQKRISSSIYELNFAYIVFSKILIKSCTITESKLLIWSFCCVDNNFLIKILN